MHSHDVIGTVSLRCSLVVLASTPVPLPGLCLGRLSLRSHVVYMVDGFVLKVSRYCLVKSGRVEH